MAAAAQQLLTDEPAIATAVEEAGVAADRIPSILETTRAQPSDLTVIGLIRRIDLPVLWRAQGRALGIR